jgi:hypothetical protein
MAIHRAARIVIGISGRCVRVDDQRARAYRHHGLRGDRRGRTLLRKLLFGAAASALLAPAAAHAETTGFVDAAYEHSQVQGGGSAESWNLGVGVEHDFDNGWGVQADGRTTHFDAGFTPSTGYGVIHVFTALNQNVDVAGYAGQLEWLSSAGVIAGVEARVHQGQWWLEGSYGYLQLDPSIGTSEVWDTRLLGAWFVNQDTALTPILSYTEWQDTFFTDKQTAAGIGAAHRFSNGLQVYGSYVHSEIDSNVDGQYQVDSLRIGVRLNFNAGDLQTIYNEGASWYGAAGLYEAMARF